MRFTVRDRRPPAKAKFVCNLEHPALPKCASAVPRVANAIARPDPLRIVLSGLPSGVRMRTGYLMDHDEALAKGDAEILVGITSAGEPLKVVAEGHRLAQALNVNWHVLHIDTASGPERGADGHSAAEALSLATELGASVASLPAATVEDGLLAFLRDTPVQIIVVPARFMGSARLRKDVLANTANVMLHLVPTKHDAAGRWPLLRNATSPNWIFAGIWIVAGVLAATVVAAGLHRLTNIASISLVFLLPVIAMAARQGLGTAMATALASALAYNFVFVEPAFEVKPWSSQNWFMGLVLVVVGAYTSLLTQRLRSRAILSDRSARQNAGLAALATDLTHQNSWAATADILSRRVAQLFDVECAVLYERAGRPCIAASVPHEAIFGPVDLIALDWCWSHHEAAGSGTDRLFDANWLFQPLKTEFGLLGILGVARPDGRPPVGPGQQLLFSTVVAQAALAHERLALEDKDQNGDR